MLNWCARDDQPVKLLTFDLLEAFIKRLHMLLACGFGHMLGHTDKRQLDLQGRCANQSGKLRFRLDFQRHQVQKPDFERSDILAVRLPFTHHRDAL